MKRRLLLVEDDEVFLRPLHRTLELKGYEVLPVPSGEEALDTLKSEDVDLVLTDRRLAGMDGVELVRQVKAEHPDLAVLVMTAYGTIESAVEAMRLGAEDYLVKPFETAELLLVIRRAIEFQELKSANRRTIRRNQERFTFSNIIARSAGMQGIFDLVRSVVDLDTTVLIHGETGVGKELLARSIHFSGLPPRAPLRRGQLRGDSRGAVRVRAVRRAQGRLHGGHRAPAGAFPDGERRHPAPRRDRGDAAAPAEQAAARDRGEEGDVGRRRPPRGHRRAVHRHHQQGSAGRGRARDLPPRSLLSPVRHADPRSRRCASGPRTSRSSPSTSSSRRAGGRRRASGPSRRASLQALVRYPWPGNVRELDNVIERAVIVATGDTLVDIERFLAPTGRPRPRGPLAALPRCQGPGRGGVRAGLRGRPPRGAWRQAHGGVQARRHGPQELLGQDGPLRAPAERPERPGRRWAARPLEVRSQMV